MILLDTDHLSVFADERDARHEILNQRLESAEEPIACTIVSVEELFRGWLAMIHRLRDVNRQIPAYVRLGRVFDLFCDWELVQFDERAADEFVKLRRQRVRIGAMDLKIASIALVHDAVLLTSNLRDFAAITDLKCENWLRLPLP